MNSSVVTIRDPALITVTSLIAPKVTYYCWKHNKLHRNEPNLETRQWQKMWHLCHYCPSMSTTTNMSRILCKCRMRIAATSRLISESVTMPPASLAGSNINIALFSPLAESASHKSIKQKQYKRTQKQRTVKVSTMMHIVPQLASPGPATATNGVCWCTLSPKQMVRTPVSGVDNRKHFIRIRTVRIRADWTHCE